MIVDNTISRRVPIREAAIIPQTMPALAALLEGTVVPYLRSVRELLADLKATTYNRYERLHTH